MIIDDGMMVMMMVMVRVLMMMTQISTRPTKLGKKKDDMSFDDVSLFAAENTFYTLTLEIMSDFDLPCSQDDDDDVVISLCSRDPQAVKVCLNEHCLLPLSSSSKIHLLLF